MKQHSLYTLAMVWKFRITGVVILVLAVVAEIFIHTHAYFSIVDFFGFNALYGFLSGVIFIILARIIGAMLKRGDDYYDR